MMKALFIVYNQAYGDEIVAVLESLGQRGFTRFDGVGGRGSVDGIPHLDNHAWPEYNDALIVQIEEESSPRSLKNCVRWMPKRPIWAYVHSPGI